MASDSIRQHVQCDTRRVKTSRHFIFQNHTPVPFSALCCYFSQPEAPVCYLFKLALNCVVYSPCTRVWGCLCVCVCMYALRIAPPDKVLLCIYSVDYHILCVTVTWHWLGVDYHVTVTWDCHIANLTSCAGCGDCHITNLTSWLIMVTVT